MLDILQRELVYDVFLWMGMYDMHVVEGSYNWSSESAVTS